MRKKRAPTAPLPAGPTPRARPQHGPGRSRGRRRASPRADRDRACHASAHSPSSSATPRGARPNAASRRRSRSSPPPRKRAAARRTRGARPRKRTPRAEEAARATPRKPSGALPPRRTSEPPPHLCRCRSAGGAATSRVPRPARPCVSRHPLAPARRMRKAAGSPPRRAGAAAQAGRRRAKKGTDDRRRAGRIDVQAAIEGEDERVRCSPRYAASASASAARRNSSACAPIR